MNRLGFREEGGWRRGSLWVFRKIRGWRLWSRVACGKPQGWDGQRSVKNSLMTSYKFFAWL